MLVRMRRKGNPSILLGLPWRLSGKESACQCRRCGFDPCVGKIPWRRKWQPTRVFLLGKSPRQRSLAGYRLWECRRVGHNYVIKQQQHAAGGNVNLCSHYGKQYGGFQKKLKVRTTIWPSNSTPGYISKTKKQKTPDFKRYMNPNIHNSIIYNCQDMEET